MCLTLARSFAIAMFIVVCVYMKVFVNRPNKSTSSVGGEAQNCKTVTRANTALLLISTSMPIHLLANSLIGPSSVIQPPTLVGYKEFDYVNPRFYTDNTLNRYDTNDIASRDSFLCWSAFRTGKPHFAEQTLMAMDDAKDLYVTNFEDKSFGSVC